MQMPDDWDPDRDGYGGDEDCDPEDSSIHEGADEICDGIDNDCDGRIDETCWKDVAVGVYHTCGLTSQGTVECWGYDEGEIGYTAAPTSAEDGGGFTAVTVGETFSCAMTSMGTVECWGDESYMVTSPPEEPMLHIDAGLAHACAVLMDGSIRCWGDSATTPPEGEFKQVTCTHSANFALRTNGRVEVWGVYPKDTLTRVPDVLFRQLDGGKTHVCGISDLFEVVCWGDEDDGQTDAPAGKFVHVSTGWDHACAVGLDGNVECWGSNKYEQTDVPAMTFVRTESGRHYSCGLLASGNIECWGRTTLGQGTPMVD